MEGGVGSTGGSPIVDAPAIGDVCDLIAPPCELAVSKQHHVDPASEIFGTPPLTQSMDRGRTWTIAHHKAILSVVLDNDCCFIEKQTNKDKEAAWRLFHERLRSFYPSLFGSWKLERKQVRRRILDLLRAHRENEKAALRATGRSGGVVDEEYAHLCEEVCARFEAAEAMKDKARSKKDQAREEKQRLGEVLCLQQVQRQQKRARSGNPSPTSPTGSGDQPSRRPRRASGDPEREALLPIIQNTMSGLLRNDTRQTAAQEWKMLVDYHLLDPSKWPDPGNFADYIAKQFETVSCGGTTQFPTSSSQLEDAEVESPMKTVPRAP